MSTKHTPEQTGHAEFARDVLAENYKLRELNADLVAALQACLAGYDELAKESPSREDSRFIGYVMLADKARAALSKATS